MGVFMKGMRDDLEGQANSIRAIIESRLSSGVIAPEVFQSKTPQNKAALKDIANNLAAIVNRYDLGLLDASEYAKLMEEKAEDSEFLEIPARDRSGRSIFAAWANRPITYEGIDIGGLLVMRPVFESPTVGVWRRGAEWRLGTGWNRRAAALSPSLAAHDSDKSQC